MEAYTDFARVYDTFMDETPYQEWAEYIIRRLKAQGIDEGLVLELGCGTGTLTQLLAEAGYDMIGVDNSAEMLEKAQQKKEAAGLDILYLMQDMQEFELYGTVRAVICCCDSLNYLTDQENVIQTFRLVNNYLDPEGVFLFDFNTSYKYRETIGDTVIAENREDCSFIWENYYDEDSRMNEYDLTLFMESAEHPGLYEKHVETHLQRAYELAEITDYLSRAEMIYEGAVQEYSDEPVCDTSERITVLAREHGKKDQG